MVYIFWNERRVIDTHLNSVSSFVTCHLRRHVRVIILICWDHSGISRKNRTHVSSLPDVVPEILESRLPHTASPFDMHYWCQAFMKNHFTALMMLCRTYAGLKKSRIHARTTQIHHALSRYENGKTEKCSLHIKCE